MAQRIGICHLSKTAVVGVDDTTGQRIALLFGQNAQCESPSRGGDFDGLVTNQPRAALPRTEAIGIRPAFQAVLSFVDDNDSVRSFFMRDRAIAAFFHFDNLHDAR